MILKFSFIDAKYKKDKELYKIGDCLDESTVHPFFCAGFLISQLRLKFFSNAFFVFKFFSKVIDYSVSSLSFQN